MFMTFAIDYFFQKEEKERGKETPVQKAYLVMDQSNFKSDLSIS